MRVVWLSFANTIYIHLHTKANKHNDHLLNASLNSLKKYRKFITLVVKEIGCDEIRPSSVVG